MYKIGEDRKRQLSRLSKAGLVSRNPIRLSSVMRCGVRRPTSNIWASGETGRRTGLVEYPVNQVRAALTFSTKNPGPRNRRVGSIPTLPTIKFYIFTNKYIFFSKSGESSLSVENPSQRTAKIVGIQVANCYHRGYRDIVLYY